MNSENVDEDGFYVPEEPIAIGARPEHELNLDDIAEAAHAAADGMPVAEVEPVDEEAIKAQLAAELADVEGQIARGEITEDADSAESRTTYEYECKRKGHKQWGSGRMQWVHRDTKEFKYAIDDVCWQCVHESFARMFPTRRTLKVLETT